ncbi:ChaN family lipoprotein [Algivirga pacifica]|uniref:ChaN family lipoprotein n=1 Tax=Algivirga pacifica TaxID=1162670 RepID=A0ABP9DGU3_9BACT
MANLRIVFLFLLSMITTNSFAQLKAFEIYNAQGKVVTFEQMMDTLSETDVVFFGELHNNPIAHWMQLETTKALYERKKENLILGAEMFECDDQVVLDEYLSGLIPEKHLLSETKAWGNYQTDYAPLVDFAKEHQLPFIATNVPRRYASLVSKQGLEALEKVEKSARKQYLPKLPIEVDYELPSYKNMGMMMGGHGHQMPEEMLKRFVAAQAIKDATMGDSIVKAMKKANKGALFLHFNGSYHSNFKEGTAWYVKQDMKKATIANIAVMEVEHPDKTEGVDFTTADYIILVPSNMTKTNR